MDSFHSSDGTLQLRWYILVAGFALGFALLGPALDDRHDSTADAEKEATTIVVAEAPADDTLD